MLLDGAEAFFQHGKWPIFTRSPARVPNKMLMREEARKGQEEAIGNKKRRLCWCIGTIWPLFIFFLSFLLASYMDGRHYALISFLRTYLSSCFFVSHSHFYCPLSDPSVTIHLHNSLASSLCKLALFLLFLPPFMSTKNLPDYVFQLTLRCCMLFT